jgi:PAS domain S-box-containing protein
MAEEDLRLLEQQLEDSLENADIAWWQWEIRANRVRCNAKKVTMLGYSPERFVDVGYEAFTDLLHPEDHERTMDAMRRYLSGAAPIYQIDYRIRRSDGSYTWYMDRGYAVGVGLDGSPLSLRGLVFDLGIEQPDEHYNERVVRAARSVLPPAEDFGPDSGQRMVSVCAVCRRIRVADARWVAVSERLPEILPARVSHGICPECMRKMYPEVERIRQKGCNETDPHHR